MANINCIFKGGTKTGLLLFQGVVGTGLLFHQRWDGWDSPLCGKTLPRLEDFLWRRGGFTWQQQTLASCHSSGGHHSVVDFNFFQGKAKEWGFACIGSPYRGVPTGFLFWGGDSVTELQLRRQTSQSCPGRESIGISVAVVPLWGWSSLGVLLCIAVILQTLKRLAFLPQREEILLQL